MNFFGRKIYRILLNLFQQIDDRIGTKLKFVNGIKKALIVDNGKIEILPHLVNMDVM